MNIPAYDSTPDNKEFCPQNWKETKTNDCRPVRYWTLVRKIELAMWAIETYDCASTKKNGFENKTKFHISTRQERCNIDVWNIAHFRLMNVIVDWDDGCLVRECQLFIPTKRIFGSNCHTCGLELEETRSLSPAWKIFETCSALFFWCAKVAGQLARSCHSWGKPFSKCSQKVV